MANVRQKEDLMKIGYIRVSKQEQNEELQIDALTRQMFSDLSHSITEICAALGISCATLYRYVKEIEVSL